MQLVMSFLRPGMMMLLPFTLSACTAGAVNDATCVQAAAHLNDCLGRNVATPPAMCDPAEAQRILAADCAALTATGGKADGDTLWCTVTAGYGWGCDQQPSAPVLLPRISGRVVDVNGVGLIYASVTLELLGVS